MPQVATINLKVKNDKTGNIDLNLEYTASLSGVNFSSEFFIKRIDLFSENKSFWIIQGNDDSPKTFRTKNIWVVGEYEGKYIVVLTGKILGDPREYHFIHAGYVRCTTTGTKFLRITPVKTGIVFSNDSASDGYHLIAYWDKEANWFGYSWAKDIPIGIDICQYDQFTHTINYKNVKQ